MKRYAFIAAVAALSAGTAAYAQQPAGAPEGGISPEMLAEISKGYEGDADDKAIRNALALTPIGTLAINAENAAMIDTHFSDRVRTKGITDQKSSGRCWLFTGLNVLRAKMIDKYELPGMEFSQNYLFFYDQLEKSNLFLRGASHMHACSNSWFLHHFSFEGFRHHRLNQFGISQFAAKLLVFPFKLFYPLLQFLASLFPIHALTPLCSIRFR